MPCPPLLSIDAMTRPRQSLGRFFSPPLPFEAGGQEGCGLRPFFVGIFRCVHALALPLVLCPLSFFLLFLSPPSTDVFTLAFVSGGVNLFFADFLF